MGFQLSPGVNFKEIDATGIIPTVSVSDGAYAGPFLWGPVEHVKLISNETELVSTFGRPDRTPDVVSSFFTCANFLAYGDKLRVVRSADTQSTVDRTFTISSVDLPGRKITFNETLASVITEAGTLPKVKRRDIISMDLLGEDAEDLVIYEVEGTNTVEIHWASELSADLAKLVEESDDAVSVVIRCYDGAANATADKLGTLIKNEDDYKKNYEDGRANVGAWAARYPGERGNSLRVSVCASADAFEKELPGTVKVKLRVSGGVDSNLGEWLQGTGTDFKKYLTPGSVIVNKKTLEERTVVSVGVNESGADDASIIKIDQPFTTGMPVGLDKGTITDPNLPSLTIGTVIAKWEFHTLFTAPGTSVDAAKLNVKTDELHVVIIDDLGSFTGIPGTILEKYGELSKASNAKLEDGTNNYYKDVINKKSKYILWTDHLSSGQDVETVGGTVDDGKASVWGKALVPGRKFHAPTVPHNSALSGAKDAVGTTNAQKGRFTAYDLFKEADKVDVALIMMGNAGASLTNYVIDNVATKRLDCVVFCSPPFATVFNNLGNEAEDIVDYRKNTLNANTSYAVMDSGWKIQIDKYNGDVEVYVPLNGDIAGLCARTDTQQEPWWSPAGYSRGQIKNCVKLLFNPDKTDRDELYKNNVNPVIEQPGEGRLLFGDKTLLTKPSAFDRINVRRLFIVLEKAISRQAKYLLFEFNDEFTRQQFRSMVEPYLRDVQSKRGIYDFRVVCDKTNNTPEIIDRNEFVGDIYIKPARSINFIQLNFIAVRTGVEFSEIVGKV